MPAKWWLSRKWRAAGRPADPASRPPKTGRPTPPNRLADPPNPAGRPPKSGWAVRKIRPATRPAEAQIRLAAKSARLGRPGQPLGRPGQPRGRGFNAFHIRPHLLRESVQIGYRHRFFVKIYTYGLPRWGVRSSEKAKGKESKGLHAGAGEASPARAPATDHCSNGAGLGGFGPFLGASALLLGLVYMGIRWRYSRSCIELLANSRACTLARSNAPRSGGAPQFTTICGSTWLGPGSGSGSE